MGSESLDFKSAKDQLLSVHFEEGVPISVKLGDGEERHICGMSALRHKSGDYVYVTPTTWGIGSNKDPPPENVEQTFPLQDDLLAFEVKGRPKYVFAVMSREDVGNILRVDAERRGLLPLQRVEPQPEDLYLPIGKPVTGFCVKCKESAIDHCSYCERRLCRNHVNPCLVNPFMAFHYCEDCLYFLLGEGGKRTPEVEAIMKSAEWEIVSKGKAITLYCKEGKHRKCDMPDLCACSCHGHGGHKFVKEEIDE